MDNDDIITGEGGLEAAASGADTGDEWDNVVWDDAETDNEEPGDGDDGGGAADQPDAVDEPDEPEQQDGGEPNEADSEPTTLEINHLGEIKTVTLDEAKPLVQKGMDYDRIKQQRDGFKAKIGDYEAFLSELSSVAGATPEQVIDLTRARMLVNREAAAGKTISEAEALIRVQRERATKAQEPAAEADNAQKEAKPAEAETRNRESFQRFAQNFPDVKAADIPKEVWDGFRDGGDLVGLYAIHQNKQLQQRIAVLEQNTKNKERSTGSRQTAGNNSGSATIEDLWDADD